NAEMRRRYQRAPIGTEWTTGAAGNTGDAIAAGQAAGAGVGLVDVARWGAWVPLAGGPLLWLVAGLPRGGPLGDRAAARVVNESAPYVHAMQDMYAGHPAANPHIPAWLVPDQRYRDSSVFAGLPPRRPLPGRWYKAGAVFRAPTVAELADQAGVDPAGLAGTI